MHTTFPLTPEIPVKDFHQSIKTKPMFEDTSLEKNANPNKIMKFLTYTLAKASPSIVLK